MTIYFYLGQNINQDAVDKIQDSEDTFVLFERIDVGINLFLQGKHVVEKLNGLEREGRAFSIDQDIIESFQYRPCKFVRDQRERIISAIFDDYKVFLLRMRYKRFDAMGAFHGLCYFSDIVDYTLGLVGENKPKLVFCGYTPHTVEAWVVVRTLEELGARIVRLISSPLPWVSLPVQGLSNSTRSRNLVAKSSSERSGGIDKYLAILRGDYSLAIPFYEKNPLKKFDFQNFSGMAILRQPKKIIKLLDHYLVKSEFKRSAKLPSNKRPYAVYFLHYQPEMNTLPEADFYVDQFQAIKKISDALPHGINLIIREHPSTFTKHTDRRWRPAGFYRRLLTLPDAYICPAGLSSFDVLDNAIFVASIAGVCLTEALARGKPAVTFYMPRFAQFDEKLIIDANTCSVSQLREIFSKIAAGGWQISEERLKKSLYNLMCSGYDGAKGDAFIPQSGAQSHANSIRSTNLAIQDILDGLI